MTSAPGSLVSAIAFVDHRAIACGSLDQVALSVRDWQLSQPESSVLVFNAVEGGLIDLDLRGSDQEIVARLAAHGAKSADSEITASDVESVHPGAARSRGRPRLGVVSREVTLLPRHWDWLASQSGGASVTLRKLVESARRAPSAAAQVRKAQDACWRFMSALGGDLPAFEEASRALFARQSERFVELLQDWPVDVRAQTLILAERAFHPD